MSEKIDLKIIATKLQNYYATSEKEFIRTNNMFRDLKSEVKDIKENSLFHLNKKITKIESDVKWIKLIGGAIIIEMLGVLMKLIFG